VRALILGPMVALSSCAAPLVHERPGNPDDNVCTPCATDAQWNRPGDNPCPCPPGPDDDGGGGDDDGGRGISGAPGTSP